MFFFALILSSAIFSSPSAQVPDAKTHPFPPFFEQAESGMQTMPDGTFLYVWASVSDLFLANRSFDVIDAWMKRESFKAALAEEHYELDKHHASGVCPGRGNFCACSNGRVGPYPITGLLTERQWQALFLRMAKDLEQSGDPQHVKRLFARLVMSRKNIERPDFPDVTLLMLAMIDAAAAGDSSCLVENHRAHQSEHFTDRYDRARVIRRFREHIETLTEGDHALAVMMLIHSMKLENEITERDVLNQFVDYSDEP